MADTVNILGKHVFELTFDKLPKPVVERTKLLLLDSLGCTIGGAVFPIGRQFYKTLEMFGGEPEAQIVCKNKRVPASIAAYANSFFMNVLDYDDSYLTIGHPGAAVIPAALAVGEGNNISGRSLITAIVAGYDVSCRVGLAIQPSLKRFDEVYGLPTWHGFGAAASAAKAMNLNEDETCNAIALHGPHAMVPFIRKLGLTDRPVPILKNNMGWATFGGVQAAVQAKCGLTGTRSFFDGNTGFWIMAGSDRCDFDCFTRDLGKVYRAIEVGIKAYPVCRYIGPVLDALRTARKKTKYATPKLITVLTTSNSARDFSNWNPTETSDLNFSIPYAVSMMILTGEPGLNWLTEPLPLRKEILNLMQRVKIVVDPRADEAFAAQKMFAGIELETQDGQHVTVTRDIAKGDPKDMLTWDEEVSKFKSLANIVFSEEEMNELIDIVKDLENLQSVRTLMQKLSYK